MSVELTMVDYYARRAQEYERIYRKPERQNDLRRLRKFVADTLANRRVLEIACGTGWWTEMLSDCATSVTACDINDEVLAIAQSKPLNRERVQFLKTDAYALPEFPQPYDGGFTGFWWSHVPKARLCDFLRDFHNALAPGAVIIFLDNAYVEGSSTPLSRKDTDGNTYQLRKLDDGSTHEVLKNFPTRDEMLTAVNGLASDVRVEFLEYYWTLTYCPIVPSRVIH